MNAAMEEARRARRGLRIERQRSDARSGLIAILLACATMLQSNALFADTIPARHTEGLIHGFLVVRTLEGKALADGQMTQDARGDRVTNHLIFQRWFDLWRHDHILSTRHIPTLERPPYSKRSVV
jgi:hypothetical protein